MLEDLPNFYSKRGTRIHFIGQSFDLIQCIQNFEISTHISEHKRSLCDALELEYTCLDLFKTNCRNSFVDSVLTAESWLGGGLTGSRPHGKQGLEKESHCLNMEQCSCNIIPCLS